jgi:hypothetical protein
MPLAGCLRRARTTLRQTATCCAVSNSRTRATRCLEAPIPGRVGTTRTRDRCPTEAPSPTSRSRTTARRRRSWAALAGSYRVDRKYDEVGMPLSTTFPATADLPAETIVHEKGRRMTHSLHRPKRLAILATVGAAAWLAATLPARLAEMRLAETRPYGPRHYAMANLQWLWLISLAALVAAWTAERHRAARRISVEVAVSLWAPALILAPVTFPRGDNDGLWGLIYAFIFLSAGATALIVGAAVAVRRGPQGLADP